MSAMTVDGYGAATVDDNLVEMVESHLRQVRIIFETAAGTERYALAHHYVTLLTEWQQQIAAVRNVEARRMESRGAGPAELGRAIGASKSRGDQIIRRARQTMERDDAKARELRRQTRSTRSDIDLAVIEQQDSRRPNG